MTAAAAPDSHAREAADLQDELEEIAGEIITIISKSRSARVDRAALTGLVDAVEALDDDAESAVGNAMKGDGRGRYRTDAEMFEAIREILDQLSTADSEEAEYTERTRRDLIAANRRRSAAEAELTAARAMGVSNPCDGCHDARQAAIEEAADKFRGAQSEMDRCREQLSLLEELDEDVADAIAALNRVPDDYEDVYASVLAIVRDRANDGSMPADGDFTTGYGSGLIPRPVSSRAAELIRNGEKT